MLLLLTGGAAGGDISVNVPLDHWVYRFVERFEARGALRGVGDGIKPFSRAQVARLLRGIEEAAAKGLELSRVERGELQLLKQEFAPAEFEVSAIERLAGRAPLLHYRREEGEVYADLLLRQQTDAFSGLGRRQSERIFRNRAGAVLRGQLGGRVGFRIAFEQVREQGSRQYWLRDDVYEPRLELPQLKGGLADYHEAQAYVKFALGFADVELGKDQALWGPAPGENLGLNGAAPSFDMLRLRTRLGAFELVSIAGALRPCPDRGDSPLCRGLADERSYVVNGQSRTLERDKWLAAHRLEVALAEWIDLGFQEVVVYGDRGLEPTYLNPLMFYWAAQSYLGDKDNVMMGLDVDVHPGNGARFYLAYVVDDLKKLKIFSDDFANKFSLQTGLLWVDPPGLKDADLRAEYARIEPWIYTHKFPINTFSHFDAPLGHSLGPNSDFWKLSLQRRFTRDLELGLELSRTRHGDNVLGEDGALVNVGGDLHRGWRPGDERQVKKFLDGRLFRRTALGGEVAWRIWPQLSLRTGLVQEWLKGASLPPRWGPHVALENRSGYADGKQRHFRLDLRYHYF